MGKSEASDDSVSLTSTVISNKTDSYEIEDILAERIDSEGAPEYLTAWKGYPDTEHDWLPRRNFETTEVFDIWTNTKIRIAEGLEKPFDVKAWEKKCKAIKEETHLRRERRRVKKLRLSKQGKSTSGIGEQDGNIEVSGSNSTPKRSDKRIKRRNVHQESPPPSSISAPTSTSSSEDSDRPLVSRQESEIFSPNAKWTEAETIALEEGLRTLKGPRWKDLLSLYGRDGAVSQVLKDKTPTDLYDKAKSIRQEFVRSGMEPPEYLKCFSRTASSRGSRAATLNSYSESRGQSRAVSKKSSRNTSVDSMMEELREKQQLHEAKNQKQSQSQQNTNSRKVLNVTRSREKESDSVKKMSDDKSKARQASDAPARKVEVASSFETLQGREQAAQLNRHLTKATSRTERTLEVKESSKDNSNRGRQPEDGLCASTTSQNSVEPQVEHRPESNASSSGELRDPASTINAQPGVSLDVAQNINQTVGGKTTSSDTARAPTAPPPDVISSRRGPVEGGSTRPISLKLKPKLGQIEPKKPSVTSDVTATWNAEPKRRKSNNWATTNGDPSEGASTKRNYKLSVQNKIYKSRREGRAPDPNSLVFIDPKTGKAPKTVSAPSANAMPPKTPLQLHQEELITKEAKESEPKDSEDAVKLDPNAPDPPPQSIRQVQTHESRIQEKKAREPSRSPPAASASVLRPATGDTTDSLAHAEALSTPSAASSLLGPPPNAPLAPRSEMTQIATMSLQDYAQRSKSSSHQLSKGINNSVRPYPSDHPLDYHFRAYPSQEHKNQIFSRPDSNLVIGDIKFEEDDQESIHVKLVGFSFEVKKLLLTIKVFPRTVEFVFKTVCLASEYKAYFPAERSDYLGSGSIISYHKSASAVDDIAETLAVGLQGGLFFTHQYTMLMYPAGASAWTFLDDNLPSVHPGTVLRFVIRKPLPLVLADVHRPATARATGIAPERYAQIQTRLQKHPVQAEDKNINTVFRDMFEIDFERLVAQNGPQQHPPTNIFFLCFIPQGCEDYEPDSAKRSALRIRTSEEHDLFIKFLQANGSDEIYSMQKIGSTEIDNNGAWDYFYKNVKSGTIIFHDAFIRYDLVPRLAKHLLHGSVNVWKASLSPMHPGEKHPHLVRLFPHGGVLLLTESLILYCPHEALRIIMWFRRIHVPAKAPGTWKIAVRPHVREWLLDIIEAYSETGKDIFGCGVQIFADIYTEIYWLLQSPDPGEDRLMCHDWDYEIPTDEAPVVSSSSLRALQARREWKGNGADTEPDDDNIRQNDDLLAQWFAEWAIVNLHNFRKYNIILGYGKDHPFAKTAISAYENRWGHVEVMTPEEAFTRHKVTPQSKLDEMEVERRRKVKEQLPAKKAATDKARREEREAAKLALQTRMQIYRDAGATDEEVLRAGRQLLRELGGTEKEIEECRVDMDRRFVDRWWERSG